MECVFRCRDFALCRDIIESRMPGCHYLSRAREENQRTLQETMSKLETRTANAPRTMSEAQTPTEIADNTMPDLQTDEADDEREEPVFDAISGAAYLCELLDRLPCYLWELLERLPNNNLKVVLAIPYAVFVCIYTCIYLTLFVLYMCAYFLCFFFLTLVAYPFTWVFDILTCCRYELSSKIGWWYDEELQWCPDRDVDGQRDAAWAGRMAASGSSFV